jgi:hypothetical protein
MGLEHFIDGKKMMKLYTMDKSNFNLVLGIVTFKLGGLE